MTKQSHRPGAATAQRARDAAQILTVRKKKDEKKKYREVFELVKEKRKDLLSEKTYNARPPQGYRFVPAGFPDLTERCKERCRQRELIVYLVSETPTGKVQENPEKISHHVHRMGFHFPSAIVDEACKWYGYTPRDGTYVRHQDPQEPNLVARTLAAHGQRMGKGRKLTRRETEDQIRATIRDLFPEIPNDDMKAIVQEAFGKGKNRVGHAKNMSLARRVQLAVGAHIRHGYTEYDHLLKIQKVDWTEARRRVEHSCLDTMKKWCGEDPEGLAEVYREIIILDDEDDEDDTTEDDESDDEEQATDISSSEDELTDAEPTRIEASSTGRAGVFRPPPPRPDIAMPARSLRRTAEQETLSQDLRPNYDFAYRQERRILDNTDPVLLFPSPQHRTGYKLAPKPEQKHRLVTARPTINSTISPRQNAPLQGRDANGTLYNLQRVDDEPLQEHPSAVQYRPRSYVVHDSVPPYLDPQLSRSYVDPQRHPIPSAAKRNLSLPSSTHASPRQSLDQKLNEHETAIPSIERDVVQPQSAFARSKVTSHRDVRYDLQDRDRHPPPPPLASNSFSDLRQRPNQSVAHYEVLPRHQTHNQGNNPTNQLLHDASVAAPGRGRAVVPRAYNAEWRWPDFQ